MATRAIIGFDHLPTGDFPQGPSGTTTAGNGLELAGNFSAHTTSNTRRVVVDSGKWVTAHASLGITLWAAIPINKIILAGSSFFYCGCRVKLGAGVALTTLILPFGAALTSNPVAAGAVFRGSDLPNISSGSEFYLEFKINVTNGLSERWIDGVKIADYQITGSTLLAAIAAKTAHLQLHIASNVTIYFRDIYFVEVTGDGSNDDRLGPIRAVPIHLDSAVGTDWGTSNGGALNTVVDTVFADASDPSVPSASCAATLDPLTLGVSSAALATDVIKAVHFFCSAKRSAASAIKLDLKVATGGVEQVLPSIGITVSMQYGLKVGVMEKAPGGTDWTSANLNAATLVIDPSSEAL